MNVDWHATTLALATAFPPELAIDHGSRHRRAHPRADAGSVGADPA